MVASEVYLNQTQSATNRNGNLGYIYTYIYRKTTAERIRENTYIQMSLLLKHASATLSYIVDSSIFRSGDTKDVEVKNTTDRLIYTQKYDYFVISK